MDSQTPKGDNYFASIQKFIFPFILLNVLAVILGASAVNIANLLDFLSPESQPNALEITDESETLSLDHDKSESEDKDQKSEIAGLEDQSTIFLTSTEANSVVKPAESNLLAYPEPQSNPQLPKPEDSIEYDKVVSQPNGAQGHGNAPKVGGENAHEKELDNQLAEKQAKPELRQLILPTVEVTTQIIDVPIINGDWDISRLNDHAGVLDGFATHPDESGALVVAAHATTEWPTAGPFAELRLMNLGDPIIYQVGDIEYVYEISRFLRVDTSNVKVLNKGGEDGIVLVTCGSYNFFTGEYGSRLIAYGNLKETRPANSNPDV